MSPPIVEDRLRVDSIGVCGATAGPQPGLPAQRHRRLVWLELLAFFLVFLVCLYMYSYTHGPPFQGLVGVFVLLLHY